jgi:hypothetical protein
MKENFMKHWSNLREKQTVATTAINARVSIVSREWLSGRQLESTKDVFVDGHCYTPAVSDAWILGALPTILALVEKRTGEVHVGMGVWVVRGSGAGSVI